MEWLKGSQRQFEIPLTTQDGKQKWFDISCTPLNSNEDQYSLVTAWDVTESRKLRESMQSCIMHITKLRESEHEWFAHKLHEEILQSLAALNLSIESVIRNKEQQTLKLIPKMVDLQNQIRGMIDETRHLSYELKPGVLDYLSLIEAIEVLVEKTETEENISTEFRVTGNTRPLSSTVETPLYLITQEAIRNAVYHGEATRIEVTLHFSPKRVRLTITDHGKGFEVPEKLLSFANLGKIGLVNMENWTLLLHGKIKINSKLNQGTTISIDVKT
jgi:signal transduction histidine kinase